MIMTDKKPDPKVFASDILITEIMLRLTALENLMIKKGVFTKEEIIATTEEIAKGVAKTVLEKVNASKNVEEFVSGLEEAYNKDKDLKN